MIVLTEDHNVVSMAPVSKDATSIGNSEAGFYQLSAYSRSAIYVTTQLRRGLRSTTNGLSKVKSFSAQESLLLTVRALEMRRT